jgi:hypothetical protein
MSEWAWASQQTEEATDLEAALQCARDHARLYGLWEVAEDLDRIMRGMHGRELQSPMPAVIRSRPRLRRRP